MKTVVIRHNSPQTARDRAVRSAAMGYALNAMRTLEASLPASNDELRIEAYRAMIRLTSKRINDPMRATGILGGAASDLTPGWTDGKTARDRAETDFKAALRSTVSEVATSLEAWKQGEPE
jgi:hypothetical protein